MNKINSWTKKAIEATHSPQNRFFPNEIMLRVFFSSSYSGTAVIVKPGMRILDVGALHGGNFPPFADRGCHCFGIEVNEQMASIARQAAANWGIDAKISIGTNRTIPFEKETFDILTSVNTIHYEDNMLNVSNALKEYQRCLRPGGVAFIVTAAPEHFARKSAEKLEANQYRLNIDDFRAGQVMTYFEDEKQLGEICKAHFTNVVTGRVTERHKYKNLDFYYALLTV